ncbi:MAG: lipoyl(octanoyl) transferase LipB [Gammaproteobacteria bacterium]|nr:lipoyl(octanoyl) transferase LipB [Gammaproteobacteria bacterium]
MSDIVVRDLGFEPLEPVWQRMKALTEQRDRDQLDEIWFVEHPPVFTFGLAGDESHLLDAGGIEVIKLDRGGQVTYHGPGQLVCYLMLDLKRRGLNIRRLVETLESAVIDTVAGYGIEAYGKRDAPGVYVGGKKLAAIGLRVKRSCSYHGLAFNVAMDLAPFERINPCGYAGLEVTQLSALCDVDSIAKLRPAFEETLLRLLAPS